MSASAPALPATPTADGLPGDRSAPWRRRIAYALLIGYAVLMFIPFAWSVITSFKTLPDSVRLTLIPQPITLQGWEYAWTNLQPPLPVLFLNSTVIAVAVTLTNLVLGSLAGYAFARLRFPGREVLFLVVLATLMIPDQLRLVPVYLIMNELGLTRGMGQYLAVITILAIEGTSVFLMRQFFISMPRELEEAARIDGAGFFTTFLKVMLPLAGPALAAVAIISFQGAWNGFFWPVVFLQNPAHYTLPIGLFFFRTAGGFATNWPPLMAVVVMATIPVLVLFVFFQRYFVAGIMSSGIKR
ncbi:carbohydrate ABC transporter permease [soil metagenome]